LCELAEFDDGVWQTSNENFVCRLCKYLMSHWCSTVFFFYFLQQQKN